MLGRRNPEKRIEAEVQDLETRHAGVLRRLDAAAAEAEQAIAAQRLVLTAEHVDASSAKKAADACRLATDRRAALEDAAHSLRIDLENAQARLAAERDRRFREGAALEVEAGATMIEDAAAELSRAAAAFDIAREKLVAACRDHAPKDVLGNDCRRPIVTAAARQAGILPRTSEQYWETLHLDAIPAAAEAVAPMRAQAKATREGSAPAALPERPVPLPAMPTFPMIRMALWRPAFYRTALGLRIELFPGLIEAPEPIAQQAFAEGVAFPPGTPAGQKVALLLQHHAECRIVEDGEGSVKAVRSTGLAGLPPPPASADLGTLPDGDGVIAEAAQ